MEQPDQIHADAMQYKVISRMPPENAQACSLCKAASDRRTKIY